MKVPFSWLKEFVDIDITPQQLQDKLFSCGFEVEELIDLSAGISKVVTGKLVHIEKQEGTDHLNLCRVVMIMTCVRKRAPTRQILPQQTQCL